MNRIFCSTLLVAAAALAGCSQSDQTAEANEAAEANAAAAVAPVALPPSIAHSKIYRCKDNSVVYIDWLSDNKTANFRADKSAAPTQLVAPEPGQKMIGAEGYSLTGTFSDASVTLERPDKGAQACKA